MAGIEEMVETVRVLQHAAGTQRRVGIGHLPVVEHHTVILISAQVFRAVFVNRVVALPVAVGIEQVIELQGTVPGHEGHDVAHIAALR